MKQSEDKPVSDYYQKRSEEINVGSTGSVLDLPRRKSSEESWQPTTMSNPYQSSGNSSGEVKDIDSLKLLIYLACVVGTVSLLTPSIYLDKFNKKDKDKTISKRDPMLDAMCGYGLGQIVVGLANGIVNSSPTAVLYGSMLFSVAYIYGKEMQPVIKAFG